MRYDKQYRRDAYDTIIMSYVNDFALKQGLRESDEMLRKDCISNGFVEICDMYFNFDDIVYDIDNNIPENKIIQWYDYNMLMVLRGYNSINYKSYCYGYRHKERGKISEFTYNLRTEIKDLYHGLKFRYLCIFDRNYREINNKAKQFIKDYVRD